jgi:hypothetical protein
MPHHDPQPKNKAAQETGAQEEAGRDPTGTTDATDCEQPGALGGDVATRSNTRPTPTGERVGG